ncbi:hypothetical protein LTR56_007289 [Elasticomyces elasticus]|nr:hypothetical protein LTR56_007289 [Elasticomyces elasticus]KAK3662978.1 hypothetical protein LTR22_006142 [Elasticomyces elasticus]KAK4918904.1 hypothetical protein LTR49_013376 [Elasticomyces elasticus]KAK5753788.1 hypothetical protein LTS12_016097 [Elasticomyces elasticus]
MEKSLPTTEQAPQAPPKHHVRRTVSTVLLVALTLYLLAPLLGDSASRDVPHHATKKASCVQPPPLFPATTDEKLSRMYDFVGTEAFKNATIIRHSGAVKIDTSSFDDMGPVGEDKRWDTRYAFHDYLAETFPRLHKGLKLEKVNTFGLLYTWKGSDESLKPLVLMSHQDVVPVPASTVDAWTHPPFSGHYDGRFIWGRGSSDCKNQLVAEMETVELLLEADYKPKRTVVLSFGFDEEISGREGAGSLATFLIDRYGKDGVAAIVDEGAGFSEQWGQVFALPGVAEKGYTDVHITVRYPGGHSSIPTDHTSIGILSELISKIEAVQYRTYLADESPMLGLMQCGADHAPDFPKTLKKLLGKRSSSAKTCKAKPDLLALEAAKMGRPVKYLMQTSQAVDVIEGGVKVNALPERTTVTVNHRINIGDAPEMVWHHLTALAKPIAEKYNLTLHAFDGTKEAPLSISLSPSDTTLKVAPVTPTELDVISPYSILAGTTRAVYGEEIVVAPGMMTGNTDTRYYWPITKHIFRFGPGYDPTTDAGLGNIHTVDEKVSVANHIGMVKWFTLFVQNMDEAALE